MSDDEAVTPRSSRLSERRAARLEADDEGSGSVATRTRPDSGGRVRNPFLFVLQYLREVVAELRKVIWPNRKEMVTYTIVVVVFVTFMVAFISGLDVGFIKAVTWLFG